MKLDGLNVIDLAWFLPGPFLTMTLADHGAEVIKVEPPDGDPGRRIAPMDARTSAFFRNLNRGKKSVVVDLKTTAGCEALLRLCDRADVVVESFRPGVARRLGIDSEAVRARNPRIIYCSISAFGQDGVYAARPAHDLALEAMTGVLGLTLGEDGRPAVPGIPIADQVSALQSLSGVLMALLRRQQTGRGDYLDIAMHDCLLAASANVMGWVTDGCQPVVKHQRNTGGSAFYYIYDTRDGRQLVLAGQEPKFVHNLLQALGRVDLAPLCLRGPGPHQQPVIEFLRETFRKRSLPEWMNYLSGLDVCFAPLNTLPEAFDDPNLRARAMLLADEAGRRHIAPAIRFRDEPAEPVLREPLLGEHTAEILTRIGMDEEAPHPARG
ncbi:MAG TPA: CaiB/BaiF CoA-transferase family protein [Xanthobacteraceae bacterium]|jgi:crotonobetainyl-CoA:carnitine CoA-transferase CaiB-like acyl-CoA transferase